MTKNKAIQRKKQKKKWREKNKARYIPRPKVVVNRVQRIVEPKVPDNINLEELAKVYRLEGVVYGVSLCTTIPEKLIKNTQKGNIPTHMETIPLLKMIQEGLQSVHRISIDTLEALEVGIESLVGYTPIDEEELASSDVFVRIITIPKEQGGGFCAELNPNCRSVGATPQNALESLSVIINEHLGDSSTSSKN